MALAPMLTVALVPARAEECSAIADPAKSARCIAREFVRQSVCRDATNTLSESIA